MSCDFLFHAFLQFQYFFVARLWCYGTFLFVGKRPFMSNSTVSVYFFVKISVKRIQK